MTPGRWQPPPTKLCRERRAPTPLGEGQPLHRPPRISSRSQGGGRRGKRQVPAGLSATGRKERLSFSRLRCQQLAETFLLGSSPTSPCSLPPRWAQPGPGRGGSPRSLFRSQTEHHPRQNGDLSPSGRLQVSRSCVGANGGPGDRRGSESAGAAGGLELGAFVALGKEDSRQPLWLLVPWEGVGWAGLGGGLSR